MIQQFKIFNDIYIITANSSRVNMIKFQSKRIQLVWMDNLIKENKILKYAIIIQTGKLLKSVLMPSNF